MTAVTELLDAALAGERSALARLLSVAERGGSELPEIEQRVATMPDRAFVIGITGPPGAGKTTVVPLA